MNYFILLLSFFLIFKGGISSSKKKKINVDGQFYECKLPKNSFERTRGVRNRICIFTSDDKNKINEKIKKKYSNTKRKFIKR